MSGLRAYFDARVNIDAIVSYQTKQVDPSDEICSVVQEFIDQFSKSFEESRQCQRIIPEATLQKDLQTDTGSPIISIPRGFTDIAAKENSLGQVSQFLDQLRYAGMADRHEKITGAHRKTFEWIYQNSGVSNGPESSFVKWLENGIEPYWITGKAGSGKSTLMKYLCDNPRTHEYLQPWAGQTQLVIVGFFFWSSGTKMQMSQIGLLQTILYEALSQCPALISTVFPKQWCLRRASGMHHYKWTQSELLKAFEFLCKQSKASKFCFFIDGLDECAGNHGELNSVLKNMALSSDVKICISSRPWLQFEDAFGHSSNLTLQDLTYRDIKHYIGTKLCENIRYLELERNEPIFASDLVEEIAKKAFGVWLWVHLVVQPLLDGLTNSDKLSDLQKRLRSVPADLEALYGKMLDSIDDFYLENASQLFQIVLAAQSPPSLLGLSFADEEDSLLALRAQIKPLTDDGTLSRCEVMKRRLNSRCKGFLEVPSPNCDLHRPTVDIAISGKRELQWPDNHKKQDSCDQFPYGTRKSESTSLAGQKVEFLHRTVRDFITKPEIWTKLMSATKADFDPNLALCRSHLLQLKTLQPELMTRDGFWNLVARYMYHAVLSAESHIGIHMTMLNELDRAATRLAATPRFVASTVGRAFPKDSDAHWASTGPQGKHGNTLLAFLIQYEFYQLFKAKLSESCSNFSDQDGRPLLDYATIDWHSSSTAKARRNNDRLLRNKEIVKLLLEKGADPNQEYASSTPWCNVLTKAQESSVPSVRCQISMRRWAGIIELFLLHEANPRLRLNDDDTLSTIQATFSDWDPVRTKELEEIWRQSKRWWIHLGRISMRHQKVYAWKNSSKHSGRSSGSWRSPFLSRRGMCRLNR